MNSYCRSPNEEQFPGKIALVQHVAVLWFGENMGIPRGGVVTICKISRGWGRVAEMDLNNFSL